MLKKFFLLMMILSITSSCIGRDEMIERARIYYVPIGAETYIPITEENIDSSFVRYGEVEINNRNFRKLLSIIEIAKPGVFEADMLRVKIVIPDDQLIYIDNYGGIMVYPTNYLKLSGSNLSKIKAILENITSLRERDLVE